MKPSLFIASSSESTDVAHALQENLESVAEVTVWNQGVFELSRYTLESLLDEIDRADFGVFVFAPDDLLSIRGEDKQAVRDNVLFELGLFIGRLGRERNFIVVPRGNEETFRLPTDLLGLTPALYEPNRQDGNLTASLGPASSKLKKSIARSGPRKQVQETCPPKPSELSEVPNYSESDQRAILESWMASRSYFENTTVIHFSRVDRELHLPIGSTKSLIKDVAKRWQLIVQQEGDHTILFRREAPSPRRPRNYAGY